MRKILLGINHLSEALNQDKVINAGSNRPTEIENLLKNSQFIDQIVESLISKILRSEKYCSAISLNTSTRIEVKTNSMVENI